MEADQALDHGTDRVGLARAAIGKERVGRMTRLAHQREDGRLNATLAGPRDRRSLTRIKVMPIRKTQFSPLPFLQAVSELSRIVPFRKMFDPIYSPFKLS
ncbi:MAG: hypothetical protein ACI8QC_003383 [Planctomycetota bacterium]|jgi:hypothetical protein